MGRVNVDGLRYRSGERPNALKNIKKTISKEKPHKKKKKSLKGKAWKGVTCPVCLEFPHHSVLLLCSSYYKGCRPYMCATGNRFSNCLEQYKKAYAKEEKSGKPAELLCPLCRGQVKGWTVVKDARKYLNSRKRGCMNDSCLFSGSYRQLKKHVKEVHPRAKPRAIDPVMEEKWKKLEVERERSDVISTLMSSTPGAMVFGDYVIEPYNGESDSYDDDLESDDSMDDDGYLDLGSLGAFGISSRLQPLSATANRTSGFRNYRMINHRYQRRGGRGRR
ncbi:hypothetical protein Rs2_09676 [Raphanus sativus]|uniref:Uncharacterized protein LOC108847959 n=1 Tax=Raphanus sativus TaxID=3726 RepID=A0A6J0MXI0_RAPSA|nr:uncharacterized protein LOC108847959 [Raphanus sativus]XP_056862131.1 uncharacterized protein LOC130509868 [Raphanus sativus]KAJ4905964.1 hypothetical protein Rs2_09622 [Raphanus sativus]KAJ4906018.1 hypothetical protein Rs2_09676 [Raphanus sativus]